jgi:DNA-binding NtrC family response regulator
MPKEKVLVVDDDSAIRYTLTEALRAWGYDPLEASTVAAALESFDAERPSMERSGGNQTRAAELLGVSRDQLRYRLKKIEDSQPGR